MSNPTGWDSTNRVWTPLTRGQLQLHDTTDNPIVLYQFQNNINDSSGDGYHLTVTSGTERYTDIYPGTRGFNFDGATRLTYADPGRALQITGAITIAMLIKVNYVDIGGSNVFLYSYEGNGDVSAPTNVLHSIYFDNAAASKTGWFHEFSTGQNQTYTINNLPNLMQLCHFAVTRTSGNVIQFYLNGLPLGPASGVLPNPATGGTTAILNIGSNGTTPILFGGFVAASFAIYGSALSAANIKSKANACLAGIYGTIP